MLSLGQVLSSASREAKWGINLKGFMAELGTAATCSTQRSIGGHACVLGENHAKITLCYEYDVHGIKGIIHEQLDIY